mgnify:CR=1 FL=1
MVREEASRYGVCDTNQCGDITDMVNRSRGPAVEPDDDRILYIPIIFHACHRLGTGSIDISDAFDLSIQRVGMRSRRGWRGPWRRRKRVSANNQDLFFQHRMGSNSQFALQSGRELNAIH